MVDRVVQELRQHRGMPAPPRARTDLEPLPGGEAADLGPLRAAAVDLGLSPATADHLVARYGTEAQAILNLVAKDRALLAPLHPAHPAITAQVVHAARRELARTVADVLIRRIHLRYETTDRGVRAAALTARLMGQELGWGPEEIARQAEAYVAASADALNEERGAGGRSE